jgi:uncharacterized OsmC-like protein
MYFCELQNQLGDHGLLYDATVCASSAFADALPEHGSWASKHHPRQLFLWAIASCLSIT